MHAIPDQLNFLQCCSHLAMCHAYLAYHRLATTACIWRPSTWCSSRSSLWRSCSSGSTASGCFGAWVGTSLTSFSSLSPFSVKVLSHRPYDHVCPGQSSRVDSLESCMMAGLSFLRSGRVLRIFRVLRAFRSLRTVRYCRFVDGAIAACGLNVVL
jgi:hypothetical protein